MKKANNPSTESNKLYAVATIAKDSTEGAAIKKKISAFFEQNPELPFIANEQDSPTTPK